MALRYSLHAVDIMAERAIRAEWVLLTIEDPERQVPDLRDPDLTRAFRRIPEYGNRWLRVIYRRSGPDIVIVTVFFDRNAGKI